ncbi:hypothetical protein QQF64_017408 [Cirrhinus molitorella]|uniref:Uncharacterized protein n=1 Tax=Cirrhinus molitorella TaxID=172907 RepID=A0ABR3LK59_9TELE
MDLINWSLNAIDTIFSKRSAGSGEPDSPAGTFAAGYTMDAWEKWRVMCLAALSVEDIEDIYLFGTMITGLLRIGLGIALVYWEIRKTRAAVHSPTKLPGMIEALPVPALASAKATARKTTPPADQVRRSCIPRPRLTASLASGPVCPVLH